MAGEGIPLPIALKYSLSRVNYVTTIFMVVVFAVLFGYVIPGGIAKLSGVFVMEDMKQVMTNKGKHDVVAKFNEFQGQKKQIEQNIMSIDTELTSAAPDQAVKLNSQREAYIRDLAGQAPHVSIQPYNGHLVTYFWPVIYICFGCIAFVFAPGSKQQLSSSPQLSIRSIAVMTLFVYIMLIWGLWVRNFMLVDEARGRLVYANSNVDIAPLGFVMQNLNFLLLAGWCPARS